MITRCGEHRNLTASRPDVAAALRARLEVWAGGGTTAAGEGEPELDDETRKALRSLGYLDGSSAAR